MCAALSRQEPDQLLAEISGQPEALRKTVGKLLDDPALPTAAGLFGPEVQRIVISGMGSSYFSSYPTFLRLLDAGLPVIWIEAGELLHFAPQLATASTLFILVSQSGRTAELVHLLPGLPAGTPVVAVTNEPKSELAQSATVTIAFEAGYEAGASTKTHICTIASLDLLAEELLGRGGTAHAGRGARAQMWQHAADALGSALAGWPAWFPDWSDHLGLPEHLFVLGRGPLLAAATVGALITKETSHVHAEAMSVPQFRHGPLESAQAGRTAIVLVTPGKLGRLDLALAGEMASFGVRTAAVVVGKMEHPVPRGVHVLELPGTAGGTETVLHVLPLQFLARDFALRQDIVPGQFVRTGKVTERE